MEFHRVGFDILQNTPTNTLALGAGRVFDNRGVKVIFGRQLVGGLLSAGSGRQPLFVLLVFPIPGR